MRCAHVHLPLSRAPVSPLTIILSLSQVSLSPSRRPPCQFCRRFCRPVTVSLSLSRVSLSPCHCLPVTVASSSATPHHLLTLSLASLSSFYYHRASLSPLTVPLSLSQVPLSPCRSLCHCRGLLCHPPPSLCLCLGRLSHPFTITGRLCHLSPSHYLCRGRLCHPSPFPVTVAGVSVTLSPCHCLPIAVASFSVTPHRHTVSVAGVSVTLKLSQGVSVTPHCHTVSVTDVSVTLLLSQSVSVTLSPSPSLLRAPLSHNHHHPVSVVGVSVTSSPFPRLCHGCLCYHVSVILSLLQVPLLLYHSLPSMSQAPLSPRHRDLVSIVGASITPSPSPRLYRRSICRPVTHAVFVMVSLSPLSLSSCYNHDVSGTMLLSSYHCWQVMVKLKEFWERRKTKREEWCSVMKETKRDDVRVKKLREKRKERGERETQVLEVRREKELKRRKRKKTKRVEMKLEKRVDESEEKENSRKKRWREKRKKTEKERRKREKRVFINTVQDHSSWTQLMNKVREHSSGTQFITRFVHENGLWTQFMNTVH